MDDFIRDLRRAYHMLTSGETETGIELLDDIIFDMEREERERINEGCAML
jgi:hypothetical protein